MITSDLESCYVYAWEHLRSALPPTDTREFIEKWLDFGYDFPTTFSLEIAFGEKPKLSFLITPRASNEIEFATGCYEVLGPRRERRSYWDENGDLKLKD